jgi:hypothetical protein
MTLNAENAPMVQRGTVTQIEAHINSLTLPSDKLNALWLLAWADATNPAAPPAGGVDALAGLK